MRDTAMPAACSAPTAAAYAASLQPAADATASLVHDLLLDPAQAPRIALAAADTCPPEGVQAATALFQAAGFAVSRLDDLPGLAVMRTVAMLANEAADAVNQNVANARDVDSAMRNGMNYPVGPLAWVDAIGVDHVRTVLANLAAYYGDPRYRTSPLVMRVERLTDE